MGMPTSALSAVAATATWSDSGRAEMLSGLTMEVLGARAVCHAPGRPPRTRARRARRPPSVLAHHHVGGLDHRVGRVAHLEREGLDRLVGDGRRAHGTATDVDPDVGGG